MKISKASTNFLRAGDVIDIEELIAQINEPAADRNDQYDEIQSRDLPQRLPRAA